MDIQKVLEICQHPESTDAIRLGLDTQAEHKVHITGEGYREKVKQIKGYENLRDFAIKKELSKPITKSIYQIIINEQNRWVNSDVIKTYHFKGTPESIKAKQAEFDQYLSKVWKNQPIDTFIRDFCKDALYSEFEGFVFIERTPVKKDEDDMLLPGDPYIIFIPLSKVHDFESDGNTLEYLAYYMDDERCYIRVIDPQFDWLLHKNSGGVWELATTDDDGNEVQGVIPNVLGYVPSIQLSTKTKNLLVDEVKTSYVDPSITIADTYLSLYFEYVATCIRHGYPIKYIVAQTCNYEDKSRGFKCENGELGIDESGSVIKCPKCHGTGKSTPADSGDIVLIPQLDAQGNTWTNSAPGGYIASPVESIRQQMEVLRDHEDKIYLSCLGNKDLNQVTVKTATEAVINSKSLENINNNIAANIEFIWKFCVDTIGRYKYEENYIGCRIKIDRRFNLRSENLILGEIKTAKESGASYTYLNELGRELLYSRYSNNPELLGRMLVLYKLEPYPFLTTSELPTNDPKLNDFKSNFYSYVEMMEEETGVPIEVYFEQKGYKATLEKLASFPGSISFATSQQDSAPDAEQSPAQGQ